MFASRLLWNVVLTSLFLIGSGDLVMDDLASHGLVQTVSRGFSSRNFTAWAVGRVPTLQETCSVQDRGYGSILSP